MSTIDQLLRALQSHFGSWPDRTDPRFAAVQSGDPVEIDIARTLYALVRATKSHTVVETGTNVGIAALAILQALTHDDLPSSRLITFDITDHGVRALAKSYGLEKKLDFRQQSSLESGLADEIAKIDLLFLDSLPSLLSEELRYYWPLLRRTSLIAIHDSRLFHEKRAAIDSFLAEYGWSEVSFVAGRGVTLLSPGPHGRLANAPAPTYSVVVEGQNPDRAIARLNDALPQPPEHEFLVGNEAAISEIFARATQARSTYILYLRTEAEPPAADLKQMWDGLSDETIPLDYVTAPDLAPIPWNQGGLEVALLLQRWTTTREDRPYVLMPHLSKDLFLVRTLLFEQTGGMIPVGDDRDWTIAALAARLILVGGNFYPLNKEDVPQLIPADTNPLAGENAVQLARKFYAQLPQELASLPRRQWRRFMRVYYFGVGHAPLSWRDMARTPSSVRSTFDLLTGRG